MSCLPSGAEYLNAVDALTCEDPGLLVIIIFMVLLAVLIGVKFHRRTF